MSIEYSEKHSEDTYRHIVDLFYAILDTWRDENTSDW